MGNPHILVIPYPVPGHVIPLMELSQCMAKYGFKITFVNTENTNELVKNALAVEGNNTGGQIQLVSISDGLQSPEDRKKPGKAFGAIMQFFPRKVEELIEQINASEIDKFTCVFTDQIFGWALEIAERKGIKRAAFCPAAAALLVLGFSIPKLIKDGIIDEDGTPTKKQTVKLSPTMPPMNTSNFVWTCLGNITSQKNVFRLIVRSNNSMKLTDWLLCNTSYDLEPAVFHLAPNILPIGPLLASNRLGDSKEKYPEDSTCLKWLDEQAPQSVLYIAFGSSTILDPTQFQELAMGLELTRRPFLWAVRSDILKGTNNIANDAFLQQFHSRVGNQGKLIGWAPQQKVLAHPSIACFVSHCGWNSTLEGISNGIPFLCLPYFADQFFNQSYICDVWKIGLGFDRDKNGMITRGEIKNKVEELFSNGEFKERALELKKMVLNGVKEGVSHQNFIKFVQWLKG